MKIGYFLASEEYRPAELLAQARAAEEAGFHRLWISDHYHPWNDEQGESPFVWARDRGAGRGDVAAAR
jgi:alkanesulfonate monooxygenase SsuD/methylene tetrahydromethanopterin reductase-like flavin-dependent oxidoreductase (luciferase family)